MPEDAYDAGTSRRKVLKTIGAATAGAAVTGSEFVEPVSGATSENTPTDSYTHSMEVTLSRDQTGYHTSTASWYGSEFLDSRNTWIHDVSLATVGSSQWDSGARIEDLVGNYYEMFPKDYNEDGLVDADTVADRQGIYPDGRNEDLPEWVELTTDLAIGAFSAPAGFIVAADDMAEALQPKDGLKDIKDNKGFEFLYTPGYFDDNWSDLSHFQRALYESGSDAQADDDLVVHGRVGRGGGDFTTNIQFLLSFWKDDLSYVDKGKFSGDCTNSTSCTSVDETGIETSLPDDQGNSDEAPPFSDSTPSERKDAMVVSTTNPHEMSAKEREAVGIEHVDPSDPPAGVSRYDGELPSFVARNTPMTVYAREMTRNDNGKGRDRVYKIGQNIPKGLEK